MVWEQVYKIAMYACAMAEEGQWQVAVEFFNRMVDRGFEPNQACYNAVIWALGRNGCFVEAMNFYDKMVEDGLKGDEVSGGTRYRGVHSCNDGVDNQSYWELVSSANMEQPHVGLRKCQESERGDGSLSENEELR